jgi:cell division protein FtsQ
MDSKSQRSGRSIDPGLRRRVSISDEGGPDPLYVDGDIGSKSGSRRRVLIVDDGDDGRQSGSPPSSSRRSMDGRVRARRAAVRRALGRRRLVRLVAAILVVFVVVVVFAVLGSSWFGVRSSDVRVTGNVYTNPTQLNEIIDGVLGTPVVLVDTDALEAQIDEIAWVSESSVRTDWPFGLVIDIRERDPVLSFPGQDGLFRVLDADGRVLDVIDGWPFEYLLLVSADTPNLGVAEFAPPGPTGAAALGAVLTAGIRDRVSLIEVDAAGTDLRVTLDDSTLIKFGAARELFPKLVRLETVLAAGEVLPGAVVDVSTDEVILGG